ncbi:Hypothetical predicted protein [Octopus vulgaris]|uniref:Uncharacterized protein n=1 Tax=Octopus vulgaris TaxID=6645 RepID=A0AA36BQU6_OCTVU|nr:Hypothetical predicted protein [Octopus vulgaris]
MHPNLVFYRSTGISKYQSIFKIYAFALVVFVVDAVVLLPPVAVPAFVVFSSPEFENRKRSRLSSGIIVVICGGIGGGGADGNGARYGGDDD